MEATPVLDDHDRVIIRMLQENARASYQELAEAIGQSPSTARRRVERLLETKTLKLVAVPVWEKLDTFFTAFIGVSVELSELRNVGHELAKMDEICFVAMTTGQYDIVAQLILPRNYDFVRFVMQRLAPITGIRDIQTLMIPWFIKSFEQWRIPLTPDRLYMKGDDGIYEFTEEVATTAGE